MNKRKISVAIGIVVTLALLAGGWVWYEKRQKAVQVPKWETRGQQKISTEDTVDAGDWKVYRNKEFGFEIKAPEDWIVDLDNGVWIYSYKKDRYNILNITFEKDTTLEKFIDKYNNSDIAKNGASLSRVIAVENYDSLKELGAKKIIGTTAEGINNIIIFVQHGNGAYVVTYHDIKSKNDIEKIIKTFKIIGR